MKYDIETAVDRRGTGAYKWSKLEEVCGDSSENIFPFSVADNDLPTLPPIVDGLKQALGTTVFGYTAASTAYRGAVCGWMKAVSYTHLDVYKRQVLRRRYSRGSQTAALLKLTAKNMEVRCLVKNIPMTATCGGAL